MIEGPCRCGWSGAGEHLCHRCQKQPGTRRFYNTRLVCLAGVQPKMQVDSTWGCDDCWSAFLQLLAARA